MLVTGYFAIYFERGEGLLRSVRFIPAKLQIQVETALRKSGATWSQVQMDGQKAILSGTAPSELDRDDAILVAKRASGFGGSLWGGITKVDASQVKLAPPRSPYQWIATLGQNRSVSLRGFVPGQQFKREIMTEARKLFSGQVVDQTIVAGGQPTGDWLGVALQSLRQLKRLQGGEARFEGDRLTVIGQARDAAIQADVESAMQTIKRPFVGEADIALADAVGLAPPDDPTPTETTEPTQVQRLAAADCQKLVDRAMRNNVLHFESGSAEINAAGIKVLDNMVQTTMTCTELKLKISGYTDGTPQETPATALSRKRAGVASTYLRSKGVDPDRLVIAAVGFSQPDPDSALDDPAINRRVEFSVIP